MDVRAISQGRVYLDVDELDRYVVELVPAAGRRQPRVKWRRPGAHASKIEEQTMTAFAGHVRKESPRQQVDPAPGLPHNGLAAI